MLSARPEFWPVLTAEGEAAAEDVEWAAHNGQVLPVRREHQGLLQRLDMR